MTTTTLSQIAQIRELVSEQTGVDGYANPYNGFDFPAGTGKVRVCAEDPEGAIEVYIFNARGVALAEATFRGMGPYFIAPIVAEHILNS